MTSAVGADEAGARTRVAAANLFDLQQRPTEADLEWHRWIRADVASVRARSMLDTHGSPSAVFAAGESAWARAGCSESEKRRLRTWETLENRERELLADPDVSVCREVQPDYPELLRHAKGVPTAFYVRGVLPEVGALTVAIIGTRSATPYGLSAAEFFARELGRMGAVIVTGGSYGIEAMATRAALDAGGRCIVVLPCGLDICYPEDHARMYRAVVERGAILSQFPFGTRPMAGTYPRRNRFIAALCEAVVVIECPRESHALATANFANEDSRQVFVVPGPYHAPSFAGNHDLLRLGATLVTSPLHVVEDLGREVTPAEEEAEPAVSAEQERLLTLLETVPKKLDEIARMVGRPLPEVAADLTLLELSGRLTRAAGGTFCLRA